MSSSEENYEDYQDFITRLRNLPVIESADLDRAAFVALNHLDLLMHAAQLLKAYRAGEFNGDPYNALDFAVDAAAVYLQLVEFDLPFHGLAALESVEVLLASTNIQPIRLGNSCNNSASLLVWDVMDRLFETFTPPFDDDSFMGLVDALLRAFTGPPAAGLHLRKYQDRYGFDEKLVREPALAVDAEGLAEQFDKHLHGLDRSFLQAKIEIEFSRAAVYLHSVRQFMSATPARPIKAPRLVIDKDTVQLDGKTVLLDMTPERRKEAIFYLNTLLNAKGHRLSDSDVRSIAREAELVDFMAVRWDQVRKQLPDKLLALIDTHSRKGSCLILSPPSRRRLRK
jgi:hypothetical protein